MDFVLEEIFIYMRLDLKNEIKTIDDNKICVKLNNGKIIEVISSKIA